MWENAFQVPILSSGMHLTPKWCQGLGAPWGHWGWENILDTRNSFFFTTVDRGLHALGVQNWGTMGQVPMVR